MISSPDPIPVSSKLYGLTVRALIEDSSGRCLLVRRSPANARFAGTWELPGGKVESGENLASALVREVREETGFGVAAEELLSACEFEIGQLHCLALLWRARGCDGQLLLSEEHDASTWLPLAEADSLLLNPHIRELFSRMAPQNRIPLSTTV